MVTGLGVVSALGTDVATFWTNLNARKLGFARLPALDRAGTPFRVGGHLGDLDDLDAARHASSDRAVRLALRAAEQALAHAQLSREAARARGVGVVMGTTCGANDAIETPEFDASWFAGDLDRCPPETFAKYDHGAIANAISREFGFDGPSYVVGTACSAGNHAVGEAFDIIRSGQADVVLCGGADAFTLLPVFGFYAMKSLAPEKCLPFDRGREGMILAEGAAALVVESLASARARGAAPLAEVRGWALNCDAKNFAAPLESGERCEQLIVACLRDARLAPNDVDYINVHGTGTVTNDLMEARGIARVYRDSPYKVPLSSIKGMLGHTLGAAGAIEALTSTLVIQNGCIPPNTPAQMDDGVDLNLITEPTRKQVRHVMSLSFAFGGCNVATLFSRPEA